MLLAETICFAHRVNRNANGILLLPPASVMIAEETKGPTNADVLPTYGNTYLKSVNKTIKLLLDVRLKIGRKTGTCKELQQYPTSFGDATDICDRGDTSLIIV